MTTTISLNSKVLPWYKQRWPWLLISIPAVSVVGGFILLWFAVTSWDGLVVDDYYKEGQAIGQTMARSMKATELGLTADVSFNADQIRIALDSSTGASLPVGVVVTIAHPTREGYDQHFALAGSQGIYSGTLEPLMAGHWQILIEDESRVWRLNGTVDLPTETKVRIVPYGS